MLIRRRGRRSAGCRRCCSSGAGRAVSAARGFRPGSRLRFRCGRRSFGAGRAALARVVVYIKAAALEVQAGRGQRALQRAAALGASLLRLNVETLNFFKSMAALGAAIRIQRQGSFTSSRRKYTLCLLYRQGRNHLQLPPCRPMPSAAGPQCMWMGTDALWSSQARVRVPRPSPLSVMVQTRFSTIAGGLLMVIFTLPRSLVLS